MDEVAGESMARARFDASLMSIICAIGLLLSAVGIYGLMAHAVEQRLAASGMVAGGLGASNLTRFLAAFLFGATPHDAVAFSAVAALLAAAAVAVPAYRAAHVDPIAAFKRG